MPTIPTYDLPQVQPAALPGYRQESVASPYLLTEGRGQSAFGAALSNTADVVQKVEADTAEKKALSSVFDAQAKWENSASNFRVNGIESQLGVNASGVADRAGQWADTVYQALDQDIEAPIAKEAFRKWAAEQRAHLINYATRHEAQQNNEYLVKSADAAINNISADAAANVFKWQSNLDAVQKNVAALSQTLGLDEEQKKALMLKYTTNFHVGVLRNLAISSPDMAAQYFDINKDGIDGRQYYDIAAMLKHSNNVADEQKFAADITSKTTDEAEALRLARTAPSLIQDNVVQRVKEFFSEKRTAQADAEKQALAPIELAVGNAERDKRGSQYIVGVQRDGLLNPLMATPHLYANASSILKVHNDKVLSERHQAEVWAQERAARNKDPALLWLQTKLDMIEHPDVWKNADLNSALFPLVKSGQLKPADAEEAITIQKNIRDGKTADYVTLTTGSTYIEQRLRGSIVDGQDYLKLDKEKQEEVKAKAFQVAEPMLLGMQKTLGRKASHEEVKQVIDAMFTNAAQRSTFLGIPIGASTPVVSFHPEDAAAALTHADAVRNANTLPQNIRTEIERQLRQHGYSPTPENVWNMRPPGNTVQQPILPLVNKPVKKAK